MLQASTTIINEHPHPPRKVQVRKDSDNNQPLFKPRQLLRLKLALKEDQSLHMISISRRVTKSNLKIMYIQLNANPHLLTHNNLLYLIQGHYILYFVGNTENLQ